MGLVAVGLFVFSGKIRRRAHFFISTHFYINKYEYRDEWLALSQQLQGALSEAGVVKALRGCWQTVSIPLRFISGLGNRIRPTGIKMAAAPEDPEIRDPDNILASNDPLVCYLKTHSFFHVEEAEPRPTMGGSNEKQ